MSNSYNRYVYASNNPLMYVDLDGENQWGDRKNGGNNFQGSKTGGLLMPSNNNSIIGFNIGSSNSGYVGYSGPSGFGNAGSYNSGYSGGDTGLASLIYGAGKWLWSLFHQPKGPELHASGKILAVRKAPQSAPKQTLAPRTESGYQSSYSGGQSRMGSGITNNYDNIPLEKNFELDKSMTNKDLRDFVNVNFQDNILDQAEIKWSCWNRVGGLTETADMQIHKGPYTVHVCRYMDKNILYDCVAHELFHIQDYYSGRALKWRREYKKDYIFIMDYWAFKFNQRYNLKYRNGKYDYSRQIEENRKQLPC